MLRRLLFVGDVNMRRILSAVGSNCFYALRSGKFWAVVGVFIGVMLLYTFDLYKPWAVGENGLPSPVAQPIFFYILWLFDMGLREFSILICAVPAAGIFAEEWCSGRFIYSYTRNGKLGYTTSTVLSAFFIAAMTCAVSMILYMVITAAIGNSFSGDVNDISFIQMTDAVINGGLLLKGHTFLFYFLLVLTYSCGVGVFSAGAVLISVLITNQYIAVVSSMVLYTVLSNVFTILHGPRLLNVWFVFGVVSFINEIEEQVTENFSVVSMLYPFIFAAVMLMIFITASYFLIKRKYEKKPI